MKHIGLTGGIGSGKTTVSKILVKNGIPVYDSDSNAKLLMNSSNEIKKLMYSGFFRDCDLPSPSPDINEITDKYNKLTGESDTSYDNDNRYTLLEMQVNLDLVGFEDMENGEETGIALPYIVTMDKSSRKILSIKRNYEEDDPTKERRQHHAAQL